MTEILVFNRMSLGEVNDLVKYMERYKYVDDSYEREVLVKEIREYIEELLDTSFYDGLECRIEKTLEKRAVAAVYKPLDKEVLLLKPKDPNEL